MSDPGAELTHTLPRGRHGLSRDVVVTSQRARMLRAMAEAMTEHGYVGTPVAEIIKRAGVSRETFYQQFSSKQDCFLAALDETVEQLAEQLVPALATAGTPLERISRLLASYLDSVAGDPVMARMFLVESYAAGPEVAQRRAVLQRGFIDALGEVVGADSPEVWFACEALVAAVIAMVTNRVAAGRSDEITALHEPLTRLITRVISSVSSPPVSSGPEPTPPR
jgi:AcrR family transcriptional regulator